MLVIYHRSGIWKKNRGCSLNLRNNKRISVADPGGVRGVKSNPPLAHSLV